MFPRFAKPGKWIWILKKENNWSGNGDRSLLKDPQRVRPSRISFCCTLSSKIMEVENHPKWKETSIGVPVRSPVNLVVVASGLRLVMLGFCYLYFQDVLPSKQKQDIDISRQWHAWKQTWKLKGTSPNCVQVLCWLLGLCGKSRYTPVN